MTSFMLIIIGLIIFGCGFLSGVYVFYKMSNSLINSDHAGFGSGFSKYVLCIGISGIGSLTTLSGIIWFIVEKLQ